MIINQNMMANNAYVQLLVNQHEAESAMENLALGLKINREGDNAVGLAIWEKLRGEIRGFNQLNCF